MITALIMCVMTGNSYAINGVIVKKANNERLRGDIRWQQSQKQYLITIDGITLTLPPEQVAKVIVPKPDGYDKAVNEVKNKRYDAALPVLDKIMTDYKMLDWDIKAARYAAEAQLGLKNPNKAIIICEKLISNNPQAAYQGDLAAIYWQALVDAGRTATLKKIMSKAIKSGPRELAVLAQVRRADVEMKNGNYKKALVDGYLRTIYFFKNDKKYVAESLYKAILCFQQLNEPANAEKMRKKLMEEFPDSEYSKKISMNK